MKIILGILGWLILSVAAFAQTGIDTSKWFVMDSTWATGFATDIECNVNTNVSAGNGLATFNINYVNTGMFCIGGPFNAHPYPGQTMFFTGTWMFMRTFSFTYPATIKIVASMPGLGDHAGLWMLSNNCQTVYKTDWRAGALVGSCATHYEVDFCDYLPGSVGVNNCQFSKYGSGTGIGAHTYALTNPTQLHTFLTRWTSADLNLYLDGSGSPVATITSNLAQNMFVLFTDEITTNGTSGLPATYPLSKTIQSIRICNDSTVACDAGDPTIVFEETFTTPSGTTVQNTKIEKATQQ